MTYWKFNRNAELSLASKSLRRLKKEGVPTKGLKKLVNQKFEGETAFLDAIGEKIGAATVPKSQSVKFWERLRSFLTFPGMRRMQ